MAKKATVSRRKSWKKEAERLTREVAKLTALLEERDALLGSNSVEIKALEGKLEIEKKGKEIAEKNSASWRQDYRSKYNAWFALTGLVIELEEKVQHFRKVGQIFAGMSLSSSASASFVEVLTEFRKRSRILGLTDIPPSVLEEVVKGGQRQLTKLVFSSDVDLETQQLLDKLGDLISGKVRP